MTNKLEVRLEAVNGGQSFAFLTGKSDIFQYQDGHKVSDTPIGTKLSVTLQGARYALLAVKIFGDSDPLPKVSDDDIAAACASGKPFAVRFEDCKISLYSIGGQMVMSAVASSAEVGTVNK